MSEEFKNETETNFDETNPSAETQKPENSDVDNKVPYDRFKSKVDEVNVLKQRLDEIEKERAEAERKKLEEASEFKALYEAEKAAREQIEESARKSALETKKQTLLIGAGYDVEKLPDILGFITGEDEEAIEASINRFKSVAPPAPTYVDPGAGNGARKTPEQKEITDYGRELYDRVFKTNKK